MSFPLISVIVPCYNAEKFIEECLQSIISQRNCHYEVIVVDGGSEDGTVDIIYKYEAHIKKIISEKDGGQSDAINKGLRYCSGDLFSWLNADDFYEPNALLRVSDAWMKTPGNIITGKTRFFGQSHGQGVVKEPKNLKFIDVLSFWRRSFDWAQPSTFFPFCNSSFVDSSLHMAMDYDLLLRTLKHTEVSYLGSIVANFRVHEDAKTARLGARYAIELPNIIARYSEGHPLFCEQSFRKFRSQCSMILFFHSIRNFDALNAFTFLRDALALSPSQSFKHIFQYIKFKFFGETLAGRFDSFKLLE